jgi:hypothetical protein
MVDPQVCQRNKKKKLKKTGRNEKNQIKDNKIWQKEKKNRRRHGTHSSCLGTTYDMYDTWVTEPDFYKKWCIRDGQKNRELSQLRNHNGGAPALLNWTLPKLSAVFGSNLGSRDLIWSFHSVMAKSGTFYQNFHLKIKCFTHYLIVNNIRTSISGILNSHHSTYKH